MDIHVGVDSTDHIVFFCPECDETMHVKKVQTEKVVVKTVPLTKDKCTWVHLWCPKCKERKGWRKFYWTEDANHYCNERTDK